MNKKSALLISILLLAALPLAASQLGSISDVLDNASEQTSNNESSIPEAPLVEEPQIEEPPSDMIFIDGQEFDFNLTPITDEEILLYGAPDLIIQDIDLSIENTETAVILYVTATVANIGDRVAEDAEINFYMGHQNPERGFSSKTLTLPPGTKKELMTFWAISDVNANIFVIADPDYKIKEYDDDNNMKSRPASQAWIGGPIEEEEAEEAGSPVPFEVFLLLGVIIVALLVLIKFSKKSVDLVVPESLYAYKKEKKNVYSLREEQMKGGKKRTMYAPFSAEESFLTSVDLKDKDKKLSEAIVARYNIPKDYADAAALSKRLNSILLVDQKQAWVQTVSDELKLNTKTVF